jgi:hypothetical protein
MTELHTSEQRFVYLETLQRGETVKYHGPNLFLERNSWD